MTIFRPHTALALAGVSILLLAAPASAQPGPRGWGPGMMLGPGVMGGMMSLAMCDPRAAGLAEWRIEIIERAVKPTDAQRSALDQLKTASAKAAETIAAACPRDLPETATARLELMEKRLEAMLAAVKTVRPTFDAFYATLSTEQKTALDLRARGIGAGDGGGGRASADALQQQHQSACISAATPAAARTAHLSRGVQSRVRRPHQ
jgi:hypothetical protein